MTISSCIRKLFSVLVALVFCIGLATALFFFTRQAAAQSDINIYGSGGGGGGGGGADVGASPGTGGAGGKDGNLSGTNHGFSGGSGGAAIGSTPGAGGGGGSGGDVENGTAGNNGSPDGDGRGGRGAQNGLSGNVNSGSGGVGGIGGTGMSANQSRDVTEVRDINIIAGDGGDGGNSGAGSTAAGGSGGTGGSATLEMTGTRVIARSVLVQSGNNGAKGVDGAVAGSGGQGGAGGTASFKANTLSADSITLYKNDGALRFDINNLELNTDVTFTVFGNAITASDTLNVNSLLLTGSGEFKMGKDSSMPLTVGRLLIDGGRLTDENWDNLISLSLDKLIYKDLTITLEKGGATVNLINGPQTLNRVLAGTGGLTKTGAATLTLGAANTYSGGTTLSAGQINLGHNSALGSGGLSMAAGTTLGFSANSLSVGNAITLGGAIKIDNGAYDATLSGTITGTGASLTKIGTGTLTLGGSNSYTGGTTLSEGRINIGRGNSLGSGALSMLGNTTLGFGANNLNVSNSIGLDGISTIIDSGVYNSTLSGAVTGTGSLKKTGSGTLTLSGTNTYAGGTTINEGLINFNKIDNFGSGNITLDGGGLQWATGNATDISSKLNTLGVNGGIFDTNGNSVTLATGILGSGSLTKAGAGTLTLSENNNYTGGTTVKSGTLQIGSSGITGWINGNIDVYSGANVTFNRSNDVFFYDNISGGGSLTKAGAGTLTLTGINTYAGETNVEAGTLSGSISSAANLRIAAGATYDGLGSARAVNELNGSGKIINTGEFTVKGGNFSGNITADSLIMNGAGKILTLTGINTFNIDTKINAGLINFNNIDNNFGGKGVTLDGGGLQWAGGNTADISLSGKLNPLGDKGGIFDTNGNTVTLSGDITGGGTKGLEKTGAGNLILTGENNYIGDTIVSGGTLQIGNGGGRGSIVGNITNNAAVSFNRSDAVTFGGNISGTGSLTKDGAGALTLIGTNSYNGDTTINTGTLALSGTGAISSSNMVQIGSAGVFNISNIGTAGSTTIQGLSGQGSVVLGDKNLNVGGNATSTFSGVISGVDGSLTKSGTGTLTLSGANTYTGGTTINEGTLRSGSANAFVRGDYIINGGTLDLNGNSFTMTSLSGTAGRIALGSAGLTLNQASGINTSYGGVISGSGYLTKDGAGELILTGANTYTGGTRVTAGKLLGNTVSLQGNIVNYAALEFNQTTAGTYTGDISGTGTLTLNGSLSNITLVGDINQQNVFINNHALNLNEGSSLTAGDAIAVANGSQLGIFVGNAPAVNAGTVNAVAGSILNINNYIEGEGERRVISTENGINGNFILYVAGAAPTAGLQNFMKASLEKENSNKDLILQQSLVWKETVDAHGNFYIAPENSFTLATSLENNNQPGAGTKYNWNGDKLTKTGAGMLTLTGNNTYTGGTEVSAGILQIGNGGTAGWIDGNIDIFSSANVSFNRSDAVTFGGNIIGAGSLTKAGAGTLTLGGNNTYGGETTVGAGTLAGNIANNTNLTVMSGAAYDGLNTARAIRALNGAGSVINNSGLTVQSGTFNGVISGAGGLTKTGAGTTLYLAGANTYTGGTTVNAGTLSGNTVSLRGDIVNNAALEFNQTTNGTYAGNISGDDGNLILTGAGEITMAGNVTQKNIAVNNSALFIAEGSFLTANGGNISVAAGSRLSIYSGTTPTINAGTITAGEGAILNVNGYAGEGVQTVISTTGGISGDFIMYAGGTPLPEPGLDRFMNLFLADNNRVIQQSLVWNDSVGAHGNFNIAAGNNFNLAGALSDNTQSGAGIAHRWDGASLTKTGAGTLVLTGANTYTGGTKVNAGTLQIGDGGTKGGIIGDIDVHSNANVTFNRSDDIIFVDDIYGGGSLTKDGAGTLTLTGINTYGGSTTVSAGTLAGNIAVDTDLTVAAGAKYDALDAARTVRALNGEGDVINNKGLTVQNGAFNGIISGAGGLTKTGAGTLTLSGANTYTGLTEVRGGTLALAGGRISNALALHGGTTFDTGGAQVTLSSLDVWGTSIWQGNLNMSGKNMNFYLPDTMAANGKMLAVSGRVNIADSDVFVDVAGDSSPLKSGDMIILMEANQLNGAPSNNTSNSKVLQQGVTLKYDFNLSTSDNKLLATVSSPIVNEQTKALSAGYLGGGLALVNQGAGLIDWKGINEAVSAAWRTNGSGSGIFAAFSGGSSRYDTGSSVELSSLSMLAGYAWGEAFNSMRTTFGPFFEYGSGSYDTYNSFTDSEEVNGNGDANYLGGGLLGRIEFIREGKKNNSYIEGSFRAGVTHNEYLNPDLRDRSGRSAGYDSSKAYFGLHAGAGYVMNFNSKTSVDLYGKFFWTQHQGDSVTLSTGDPIDFRNAYSRRMRFGGRLSRTIIETLNFYAGAAYEYEFDGKLRATTNGFDIATPSLRGGTLVEEFGLSIKPSKTRSLFFDLGLQGYEGKNEGFMGTLQTGLGTGQAVDEFWGSFYLKLRSRFEF